MSYNPSEIHKTQSALLTFLLAMVCHPEVAKRAQIEIDLQIGHDRLLTLKDRALLPYIDCILKETLRFVHLMQDFSQHLNSSHRWNPPIPLGNRAYNVGKSFIYY